MLEESMSTRNITKTVVILAAVGLLGYAVASGISGPSRLEDSGSEKVFSAYGLHQ